MAEMNASSEYGYTSAPPAALQCHLSIRGEIDPRIEIAIQEKQDQDCQARE